MAWIHRRPKKTVPGFTLLWKLEKLEVQITGNWLQLWMFSLVLGLLVPWLSMFKAGATIAAWGQA